MTLFRNNLAGMIDPHCHLGLANPRIRGQYIARVYTLCRLTYVHFCER